MVEKTPKIDPTMATETEKENIEKKAKSFRVLWEACRCLFTHPDNRVVKLGR